MPLLAIGAKNPVIKELRASEDYVSLLALPVDTIIIVQGKILRVVSVEPLTKKGRGRIGLIHVLAEAITGKKIHELDEEDIEYSKTVFCREVRTYCGPSFSRGCFRELVEKSRLVREALGIRPFSYYAFYRLYNSACRKNR